MRIAYAELTAAVGAALERCGLPARVQLQVIEPPRPWGVTCNACFTLGAQFAASQIEAATAGLDKKAAKEAAGRLAREAGIALAQQIAGELDQARQAGQLTAFIARVEAEGAYLNFYYDARALAELVIATTNLPDPTPDNPLDDFGSGTVPKGERKQIMVEYAQPNTHKDFHVGHLRNASIGQAIANLLEFSGHTVYKATYLGDVGAHVAKAMVGATIDFATPLASPGAIARFPSSEEDVLRFWGACYKRATFLSTQLEFGIRGLFINKAVHGTVANASIMVSPEAPPFDEKANAPLEVLIGTFTEGDLIQPIHFTRVIEGELISQDMTVSDLIERHRDLKDRIEGWLSGWEQGDPRIRQAWTDSRESCIKVFASIFAELNVDFHPDCWFYESTVDDSHLGQKTAEELKQRGVAIIDESEEYKGALFVDFAVLADAVKSDGTPVFADSEKKRIRQLGKMTILRSNGTSLYQTKELGLAKYKFDWVKQQTGRDLDESLYVVGAEQKLYFEQVFAILRLWGFPNADKCKHIAYELVVLPEGKMSSREGTVVSYRELRDAAVQQAQDVIREKGIITDEAQIVQTAHDVAIAAIKYTMLQVSGNQQIVFDFAQALSFDGRAAPYLQYAYARAGKLVAEAKQPSAVRSPLSAEPVGEGAVPADLGPRTADLSVISETDAGVATALHDSEIALARLLSQFPETCRTAAERYEPAIICNYLYAIADAFSAFYRDCRVLGAAEPERTFRQGLTRAFRYVMKTGFNILALPLPEAM